MSTHGARRKESICVTTFRVGKILKWAVPLFFLPLSLSQLPDVLGSATEWRRKEMGLLEFIHTAHRAALASLPVCKEVLVPLTKGDRKRQTRG